MLKVQQTIFFLEEEVEDKLIKEMKHQAQVVMLPTEDKSNIYTLKERIDFLYSSNKVYRDSLSTPQHLYITVDQKVEPTKEGDWCIITNKSGTKFVCQFKNKEYHFLGDNQGKLTGVPDICRKIIATTDKKIAIKWDEYTVENTSYKTNAQFVIAMIHQSFIKEYCKNLVDKVMVEYDLRLPDCTRPRCLVPNCSCVEIKSIVVNSDNTINISLIEEKMYSGIDLMGNQDGSLDHFLLNSPKFSQEEREVIMDAIHEWIKENL
jgi:hypothetical protein